MSSIYVIIPSASITQAMINRSLNRKIENIKANLANTMLMLEVEEPVPSIYYAYQWYNRDEAEEIMQGAEWQE